MAAAIRIALAGALLLAAPAGAAEGGESALRDIGFRVLNVLMLLALLLYFARKPIQNFFSERRNRIRDEIKQASELRREAEERHSKWQRRLVDLEAELESIRGAARERAEREREQILADARAAAQRIQSDAHMAIDRDAPGRGAAAQRSGGPGRGAGGGDARGEDHGGRPRAPAGRIHRAHRVRGRGRAEEVVIVRSSAVARRYARALFSLASETSATRAVRGELERMAKLLAENPALRAALFLPLHPAAERHAVLRSISARLGASDTLRKLLLFLIDQRRLVDFDAIRLEYERLDDEATGRLQAEVIAASPLDDRQLARVRSALAARTGREIELEVRVDRKLIGGAIAMVGGLVFDGSLRTQLSQLRDNLTRGH
ncbi:MAG: ATP synthase F1 subunit delta [Myxococcales bacterium]|nr:ATP synthase F1 subunit delta [Myxococcales bacterium]